MKVEHWYDHGIRLWTALWLDEEGNQQGEAQYVVRRSELKALLERMKNSEPQNYQV